MKRTTRHPIRTLLLQVLRIRLYYPHQIGTVLQIVDEVLVVEHFSNLLSQVSHAVPKIQWDR